MPVIMRTHEARERNLKRALAAITRLEAGRVRRPHSSGSRSISKPPWSVTKAQVATTREPARLTRWPGLIEHYRRFLPVTDKTPVVTLNEGNTPLIESPELAERLGQNIKVYLKFEGANPTGSFKDRGMTVAISKALGEGVRVVMCASTGNTSASAAAYAARAGLQAFVLIPKGAVALGKLSQSVMHGARVVEVIGNFDICLKVVRDLAERDPLRIRLVNSVNPDRIAGQKTAAFEICDQLGDAPTHHFLPVGNAGNITAYWAGYREYQAAGLSHAPAEDDGLSGGRIGADCHRPCRSTIRIPWRRRSKLAIRRAGKARSPRATSRAGSSIWSPTRRFSRLIV